MQAESIDCLMNDQCKMCTSTCWQIAIITVHACLVKQSDLVLDRDAKPDEGRVISKWANVSKGQLFLYRVFSLLIAAILCIQDWFDFWLAPTVAAD